MRAGKILRTVIGGVVMINVAIVVYVVMSAATPKTVPPTFPNPNGYDEFVRAGLMLTNTATTNDYRNWTHDALASFVATNEAAFALARTGFSHECRATDMIQTNDNMPDLMPLRKMAFAIMAEGWLAKSENRTNDSIHFFLDSITLAVNQAHGGIIITKLVGIACEKYGRNGLRSWIDELDAKQCRDICAALEKLDSAEEPFESTLSNDKYWVKQHYSIVDRARALLMYRQEKESEAHSRASFQQNTLGRRQTIIDFAERAYLLEQGRAPAKLEDLVPNYLKALPSTEIAGTNMAYHL